MQSILGGAVMSLFLIALYVPWFTNASMLVAIVVSVVVNIFLMAGCMEVLPHHGVCSHSVPVSTLPFSTLRIYFLPASFSLMHASLQA